MSDVQMSITIPKELEESLETLAHDLDKPVEYIIVTALEKYVRDCEESGELD